MECDCGGVLIQGKSSYRISRDNFCLIIDNIIAYKCTRCEKVLFKEDIVEKINKLVTRMEREANEIISGRPSVHTYDY